MTANNPMNPLYDFVHNTGWYHDDEWTGFRGYVPALTHSEMRAIAETAGVQFLAADTDAVVCPGEKDHVFPTVTDECKVVDDRGIPRLTGCSNAGCECKCADKNATMAAIRFENVRVEQSLSVSERDQATTDRLVQEMREAHEREAHWQWERENEPVGDRLADSSIIPASKPTEDHKEAL